MIDPYSFASAMPHVSGVPDEVVQAVSYLVIALVGWLLPSPRRKQ